ncbi:MAG: hypothetical protein V4567_11260 [Pseudomonadota bacterium]
MPPNNSFKPTPLRGLIQALGAMKVSSTFAIILALFSTAAWSASKCVLPKPLKDEAEHSDPIIWGPVVRMTATGIAVKNDARPNAVTVSIHLNNKTVFFDMQATQIRRPNADAKVYVWVWLEGCATNPSHYPAAALIVAPLHRGA